MTGGKYTRRDNLKMIGAAGIAGLTGCTTSIPASTGEPTPVTTGSIDVHAHFLPQHYTETAIASGHGHPDGMPGFPAWSGEDMVAMMDRQNITRSILSVSSPGVHLGDDDAAADLARFVNREAADLAARYPGRFGFFASLPLPDVSASLTEIDYAFDQLGASGVILESNHHGVYPGDPDFDPLLEALDRRGAVVFLHPTSPHCTCGVGQGHSLPAPILEFMFETTRVVTNLVYRQVPIRFPGIRFIIPHGGAALPALADRIAFASAAIPSAGDLNPQQVIEQLGTFYYDLAGAPLPRQLPALRSFASDSRLLYGSDWPFTPEPLVQRLKTGLEQTFSDSPDLLATVQRGNALGLLGPANAP